MAIIDAVAPDHTFVPQQLHRLAHSLLSLTHRSSRWLDGYYFPTSPSTSIPEPSPNVLPHLLPIQFSVAAPPVSSIMWSSAGYEYWEAFWWKQFFLAFQNDGPDSSGASLLILKAHGPSRDVDEHLRGCDPGRFLKSAFKSTRWLPNEPRRLNFCLFHAAGWFPQMILKRRTYFRRGPFRPDVIVHPGAERPSAFQKVVGLVPCLLSNIPKPLHYDALRRRRVYQLIWLPDSIMQIRFCIIGTICCKQKEEKKWHIIC